MAFFDINALLVAEVEHDALTCTVADYPLNHVLALLSEYHGNIADVVERLECDGWTPVEIAQGVARP